MVVGAARIVTVLDFFEKTNFIQTIILRWLHQLLLRPVQQHSFRNEGRTNEIIEDHAIHAIGV